MKLRKGMDVQQVVPVIEGKITEVKIIDDEVQYGVEYTGVDGETHTRFFKEDEIKAVPAAE